MRESAATFGTTAVPASSRTRSGRRAAGRVVAGLAATALASVAGAALLDRSADAREVATRALRIDTQRLERRLHRLDAPGAGAMLEALSESRDALRVRLVEALDRARAAQSGDAFEHRVEALVTGEGDAVVTLRLTVEGRIADGARLLDLLAAVEGAGSPWPLETRGCVVQRVDAGSSGDERRGGAFVRAPRLLVRCVVDLLHWRELGSS